MQNMKANQALAKKSAEQTETEPESTTIDGQLLNDDRQRFQSHVQLEVNSVTPANHNQIIESSQMQHQLRDDQKNNQQRNQESQVKLQRNFIDGGNFEFVSFYFLK